jgi:hypothetical protein
VAHETRVNNFKKHCLILTLKQVLLNLPFNMTIKTKLTKEDYKSASFAIIWSRTSLKIIALVFSVIMLFNIITSANRTNSLLPTIIPPVIIGGLAYLLLNFSLAKAYKNNPRVNENIEYQFDDAVIIIKGETFKTELNWDKLYKLTKTKKWLLIWHNNQIANAIPINKVPVEALSDLKRIADLHNVKNNL